MGYSKSKSFGFFVFSFLSIITVLGFQNCGEFGAITGEGSSAISALSQDDLSQYVKVGDMYVHRSMVDENDLKEYWPEQHENEYSVKKSGVQEDDLSGSGSAYNGNHLKLWPGGMVPIQFASDISSTVKNRFMRKCNEFSQFSSIHCVERNNERDFIYVVSLDSQTNCGYSFYGRKGGQQDLALNMRFNCTSENNRTIQHELMHAFGIAHEHARSDRDEHVEVIWDNIIDGKEHNFAKLTNPYAMTEDYDHQSIMHYSATAFSKNNQPTLRRKRGGSVQAGQRLTSLDREIMGMLYPKDFNSEINIISLPRKTYAGTAEISGECNIKNGNVTIEPGNVTTTCDGQRYEAEIQLPDYATYYVVATLEGGQKGTDVTSPRELEREDPRPEIRALYLEILGRDAEESGLNYWVGRVENGYRMSQVERSLKNSEEAKNKDDGTDNTSPITVAPPVSSGGLTITQPSQNQRFQTTITIAGACPFSGGTVSVNPGGRSTTCSNGQYSINVDYSGRASGGFEFKVLAEQSNGSLTTAQRRIIKNKIDIDHELPLSGSELRDSAVFSGTCSENGATVSVRPGNNVSKTVTTACNNNRYNLNVDLSHLPDGPFNAYISIRNAAGDNYSNVPSFIKVSPNVVVPPVMPPPVVTPPVVAPTVDAQEEIEGYFQKYLFRMPKSSGLNHYLNQYNNEGRSLSAIENEIKNSPEAKIIGFYDEYLGRMPEQSGLNYYLGNYNSGIDSMTVIENSIKNSNEAQIRNLYLTILGREPDRPGMDFWRGKLDNKEVTIEQIEENFRQVAAGE